ncbi:MAG: uridine kinase [Bdellovibrionota bacterium]
MSIGVRQHPFIVGIAGGSGSGKSTIVRLLIERYRETINEDKSFAIISQDFYYRDLSKLSEMERKDVNYDHPEALDAELMFAQLNTIANGYPIDAPIYDFATHTRSLKTRRIEPADIIFVDGILSLHFEDIRSIFSLKVYVDVDADIRILRRLQRDIRERGRDIDCIIKQYLESVRPMHQMFVEPTKDFADEVVPWERKDISVVDRVCSFLP